MAARMVPAPDMSFVIVAWTSSAGFNAMPPASYLIPLPTSVSRPVGATGAPSSSRGT